MQNKISVSKHISQSNQQTKKIEVGKFYLIYDGHYPGHPGLIVWKNDDDNLYLAIKFGSTPTKNNIEFEYPIERNIKKSYYYKRFYLGKRKDFGSVILDRLSIKEEDVDKLKQLLDFRNPICSKNISKKSLSNYKFQIKKAIDQP